MHTHAVIDLSLGVVRTYTRMSLSTTMYTVYTIQIYIYIQYINTDWILSIDTQPRSQLRDKNMYTRKKLFLLN